MHRSNSTEEAVWVEQGGEVENEGAGCVCPELPGGHSVTGNRNSGGVRRQCACGSCRLGRVSRERFGGARATERSARRAATARSVPAAAERQREDAERRPALEDEEATGDPSVEALLTQALNRGSRARLVEAAFHCRLRHNASVERRTLHELSGYYLVSP